MLLLHRRIGLACALLILPCVAPAQTPNFQKFAHWGGENVVTVSGRYVYVSEGPNLNIVDIMDPAKPVAVNRLLLPGTIRDIATTGTLAYIAAGQTGGIQIVNIADPPRARIVGSYACKGEALRIELRGRRICALFDRPAENIAQIRMLDTSDPLHPKPYGYFNTGEAPLIDFGGERVHLFESSRALTLDVSQPGPFNVAEAALAIAPRGLARYGNIIYADDSGVLKAIDVSSPDTPRTLAVGPIDLAGKPFRVSGKTLYVGDNTAGYGAWIKAYDLTDPAKPAFQGEFKAADPNATAGMHSVFEVDDNRVIWIKSSGTMRIVDFSNRAAPVELGKMELFKTGRMIHLASDVALFQIGNAVKAYDVSDIGHPLLLGECSTPATLSHTAVAGNTLYGVEDGTDILAIVDFSDPARPGLKREFTFNTDHVETIREISVDANRLYVANGRNGFAIYDITTPDSPAWLGSFSASNPAGIACLAVKGDIACLGVNYEADYRYEIVFVNVQNASAPKLIRRFGYSAFAGALRIHGAKCYVIANTADAARVRVFDISDRANPRYLSMFDAQQAVADLRADGQKVYLALQRDIQVFTLVNPSHPRRIDTIESGQSQSIASCNLLNGRLYIESGAGVEIIKHSGPLPSNACEIRNMSLVGTLPLYVSQLARSGNFIYAAGESMLHVIDISRPASPAVRGGIDVPINTSDIAATGNRVYTLESDWFADGENRRYAVTYVDVIEASNPDRLARLKRHEISGEYTKISVSGDHALIYSDDAMNVLDVSDPARITEVWSVDDLRRQHRSIQGAALNWPMLYCSDDTIPGLRGLDFSTPAAPQARSFFYTDPRDVVHFAIRNNLACFVDSGGRFSVADTTRPEDIRLLGRIPLTGGSAEIDMSNSTAAISCANAVYLVDISRPDAPKPIGIYSAPGGDPNAGTGEIVLANGYIYTCSSGILRILKYDPTVLNLTISSPSLPGYKLDRISIGQTVYNDREYLFKQSIPPHLNHHVYIRTSNGDKNTIAGELFNFSVNCRAWIYVAFDARFERPPAWLAKWQKTSDTLMVADPVPNRILYRKRFSAGKISLGGNIDAGMPTTNSMYSVIIVPDPENSVADWMLYQ